MNQVFFPYGISNFETLVKDNYVFVDKTIFIEKLEQHKERNVSFLRPRRFGKSLWLSILEYYYDINQAHKFDQLFGNYYIGKNPTPLHNAYRILRFDFSGIDTSTKEKAKKGFAFSVLNAVREFADKYKLFTHEQRQFIYHQADAEEIINAFFRTYASNGYSEKIYLLFDEYDHFTNDILYRSWNEFVESVSKQGYIRKFYEVIKSATQQGVVDRLFITGVSSLTLDALTSGFNILTDLTHSLEFETMLGFTEKEVQQLVELTTKDKTLQAKILQEMKEWYNGYRFCETSHQTLYNSDMVLYYLKAFQETHTAPRRLLDPNIAPDYGKLKQMFEVVNLQKNQEVLEKVLQNGYIDAELIPIFNFEKGFTQADFINFLAYLGNLTIGGVDEITGRVHFKIPNKVIEELYWQYYADILNQIPELQSQSEAIDQAVIKMAKEGIYEDFFVLLEKVLQTLSNRDFSKFNEKYVKVVMVAYLVLSSIFDVRSEVELFGGGYPDVMLMRRPQRQREHHEYVIELKYLKKEEESRLDEVREEAKRQLLRYYQQDEVLRCKPYLHLLAVVCVKDVLYVEEVKVPA
ncbi:MAG: ATP-binding protein [Bacteroidia bacterium]|nr:ATP-binding protein [Bacteroidia bacterium]